MVYTAMYFCRYNCCIEFHSANTLHIYVYVAAKTLCNLGEVSVRPNTNIFLCQTSWIYKVTRHYFIISILRLSNEIGFMTI